MEPASLRSGTRNAFTFVEMLLVLVVLAVLATIAFAAYASVARDTAVTTGANLVSDILTLGHTRAVTQNTTVEVRLYALPPAPGAAPVYSAAQLHWLKPDGTTPPVAPLAALSDWVVIDATPIHSPLIASNKQAATPDPSDPHLNADTRVFHFLPDGSTDLDPSVNWCLTIRAATQSDPAHFPSNWAAVSVDASTGRVQIYRP